jgi:hypothetical protein
MAPLVAKSRSYTSTISIPAVIFVSFDFKHLNIQQKSIALKKRKQTSVLFDRNSLEIFSPMKQLPMIIIVIFLLLFANPNHTH